MDKKIIIEKLEGLIEVTRGCMAVTAVDEKNNPWTEDIEALENAIEIVNEKEKLEKEVVFYMKNVVRLEQELRQAIKQLETYKTKVANLGKSLTEETVRKIELVDEKQELIEALGAMVELARQHLISANSYGAVTRAVDIIRKHIQPTRITG